MDDRSAFEVAQKQVAELNEKITKEKNVIADSQAKIASFDRQLAELQNWVFMWHRLTGTENPTAAERIQPEDATQTRRPKNPDREVVVNYSLEFIRSQGAPQSRKDIFDALAKRGLAIHGKNPEMVLSTMLWRSQDKIVRIPGHGYWPQELAWEDALYFPNGATSDLLDIAAKEPEDGEEADDADD